MTIYDHDRSDWTSLYRTQSAPAHSLIDCHDEDHHHHHNDDDLLFNTGGAESLHKETAEAPSYDTDALFKGDQDAPLNEDSMHLEKLLEHLPTPNFNAEHNEDAVDSVSPPPESPQCTVEEHWSLPPQPQPSVSPVPFSLPPLPPQPQPSMSPAQLLPQIIPMLVTLQLLFRATRESSFTFPASSCIVTTTVYDILIRAIDLTGWCSTPAEVAFLCKLLNQAISVGQLQVALFQKQQFDPSAEEIPVSSVIVKRVQHYLPVSMKKLQVRVCPEDPMSIEFLMMRTRINACSHTSSNAQFIFKILWSHPAQPDRPVVLCTTRSFPFTTQSRKRYPSSRSTSPVASPSSPSSSCSSSDVPSPRSLKRPSSQTPPGSKRHKSL